MATGDPPWKSLNFKTPVVLFYHVVNASDPPPLDGVSMELVKLVNSCFARNPALRPTAKDLLHNEYFRDLDSSGGGGGGSIRGDASHSHSLNNTSKELADIFNPTIINKTPLPSPPALELPSPDSTKAASPSTSMSSVGSIAEELQQPPPSEKKVELFKPSRKVDHRKKVERKWGVNGYQKPATAPDKTVTKNRQASSSPEMRPITAPDMAQQAKEAAPGNNREKSSLSKFKKRFQDPARISMHELQISQNPTHNDS
jgi:serine/threonine protein kinase